MAQAKISDLTADTAPLSTALIECETATGASKKLTLQDAVQVLNKTDATAAPSFSDDGYSVGSLWVDVTLDNAYICVDATSGAAVWKLIS